MSKLQFQIKNIKIFWLEEHPSYCEQVDRELKYLDDNKEGLEKKLLSGDKYCNLQSMIFDAEIFLNLPLIHLGELIPHAEDAQRLIRGKLSHIVSIIARRKKLMHSAGVDMRDLFHVTLFKEYIQNTLEETYNFSLNSVTSRGVRKISLRQLKYIMLNDVCDYLS